MSYRNDWTDPLIKELGKILAHATHESWTYDETLDQLRSLASWFEDYLDTIPDRVDLLAESPGGGVTSSDF